MTDVVMPQMGESIVEGTLTKWLKKPGDRVERDEPLFEISTDKVDTEIPSPTAGTLSDVLVPEGQTVGINTVVARIDEGGGAVKPAAAAPPKAAEPKPPRRKPPNRKAAEPAPAPPPPQQAQPVAETPSQETVQPTPAPEQVEDTAPAEPAGPLSPLVRKMARENNIDLSRVKGSGAGGRITKQDVEAYLAQAPAPPAAPAAAPPAPAPAKPAPAPAPAPQPAAPPAIAPLAPAGQAKTRIEPLSTMRQKIAEHMVMSKRTSAHVTTVHRVDMTKVAKAREKTQGRLPGQLRLLADLSAVHHTRVGSGTAPVPRCSTHRSTARTSSTTTKSTSESPWLSRTASSYP